MPGKNNFDELFESYTPDQIEKYKKMAKDYFIQKEGIVSTKVLSRLVRVPRRILSIWIKEENWSGIFKEDPDDKVNLSEKTKDFIDNEVDEFGLTEQERLFCYHYLKTFNATNSAIRAGYTPQNGHFAASQMLKKPNVKAFLHHIKGLRDEELFIDSIDIIKQYMKIAFADITDYVKFKGNTVQLRSSAEVDGTIISEISATAEGAVKIKLEDRKFAFDKLAQLLDVFPDNFKRELEKERLKLSHKYYELDKIKATGTGQEDKSKEGIDEFIKATNPSEEDVRRIFDGESEEEQ